MPAIFELGEELGRQPGADGPFNTPFLASWRAASWYLRRVETAEARSAVMIAAMAATRALSVPAVLISLDLDVREKNESGDLLFDDNGLEQIKALWIETMEARALNDSELLNDDHLVSHLYRWRDLTGSLDAPKAWVERTASDPALFTKLITRFLSVGSRQSWGDRVATKMESYRRDTMSDFFDLSTLPQQIAALDEGTLTAEEARILEILKRHLASWEEGRSTGE